MLSYYLHVMFRVFSGTVVTKYKDRGKRSQAIVKEGVSHLTFSYDSSCKSHSRSNCLLVSITYYARSLKNALKNNQR